MTTLFMHHYYVPKKAQGYVCKTDAHLQFDNADHIGREAILETYDRLFEKWKNNLPLLKELSHVLNHRIAFWDKLHRGDPENQKYRDYIFLYLELFEKSHSYITRKNHYETRKEWQIRE